MIKDMKKLLLIAMVCMLSLAACGEKEGPGGEGPDGPEVSLSDCVVPASVHAGGEGTVQWNGFKQADRLSLASSSGTEYELTVKTVTSSGLVFKVSYEVPDGTYKLVLVRDAKTELGSLKVLAPELPVTGVKVPSEAVAGEAVAISGLGFEAGCRIVLEDASGEKVSLDAELTGSGISVLLPEDLAEGSYKVYLEQYGRTWVLSGSMTVRASAAAVKTLTAVRYYAPFLEGSEILMEWLIERESPAVLTLSRYIVENRTESLDVQDVYVQGADGAFVLDEDGFEESNALAVSYVLDSEMVTRSDVLLYGDDEATPFAWAYDSDGNLTGILSPKYPFRSFAYEGGALISFNQTAFEYDEDCLVNNPAAYDVIWGYMAVQEYKDPFVAFPYLLGWYAPQSSKLPSRMISPSPTGTGTVSCELSYKFDDDGYVVEMSWLEGSSGYRVEYLY